MAALVSPPPSPPIPSSPGSLSSASSHSASDSSNGTTPTPASPPEIHYTSLDHAKPKAPSGHVVASSTPSGSPAGSVARTRTSRRTQGHRASHSMSRLGSTSFSTPPGTMRSSSGALSASPSLKRRPQQLATMAEGGAEGVEENPRSRPLSRSRTLSFSSAQQAFLPTGPSTRASPTTSSAAAALPFPSVEEGVVSSPTTLERQSSTASNASLPARRPRPQRVSLSTRSAHTLRVPQPGRGRAENPAEDLEAKVVILGSQGVGKTSLINRGVHSEFSEQRASVGASFHAKKFTIDGTSVRLQLWDPAGQERFRSMAQLYYRGALAAVLAYDVTDETSLEDLKYWLGELRKNMPSELFILVVGTKSDLIGSYPTIPLATAQRKIALWQHELDNPPAEDDSPPSSTLLRTAPPVPPSYSRQEPLYPAASRTRTSSTPHGIPHSQTFTSFPTITTTAPPPPSQPSDPTLASSSTLSSRVRKMSNKLATYGATQQPPPPPRPPPGLSPSFTMPDLSAYTSSGLSLSSSHPPSSAQESLAASAGMARSSSSGAASSAGSHSSHGMVHSPTTPTLSLGAAGRQFGFGLASLTGNRRMSHDERIRREWEEEQRRIKEREEEEERRIAKIVEECEIEVVEVSAKEGFGVEEIFTAVAAHLLTRKAEIEAARVLRSRDSIILRDDDRVDTTQAGWCAC
ncbi:hypothetical protein JCM10213_000455 [Rhodosporidiobolus nylandii]